MDAKLPFNYIHRFNQLRGTQTICYCTNDEHPKNLLPGDVGVFRRSFASAAKVDNIDFLFHTGGGSLDAAHSLSLLLRSLAHNLSVVVPFKARSAGLLFCLAANQIALGPRSIFTPMDPLLKVGNNDPSKGASRLAVEDIKAFIEMGRSWLGLKAEASQLQLLSVLAQNYPPSTLGAVYRADQYVRKISTELLAMQLPHRSPEERAGIVDKLTSGYPDHDYLITPQELLQVGLNGRIMTDDETKVSESIITEIQTFFRFSGTLTPTKKVYRAIFMNKDKAIACIASAKIAPTNDARRATAEWVEFDSNSE